MSLQLDCWVYSLVMTIIIIILIVLFILVQAGRMNQEYEETIDYED